MHGNSKEIQRRFLRIPREIFGRNLVLDEKAKDSAVIYNFSERKLEKAILLGKHPLSGDFQIEPFVVCKKGKSICRCIVTLYDDEEVAYVGFFASYPMKEAVTFLFEQVEQFVRRHGRKGLVGPLDASFFINYRFKINRFDKTYTGEPINPSYYPGLWEQAGFQMCDHYSSNLVRIPTPADVNAKCQKRLAQLKENAYVIVHPTKENFTEELTQIYASLIRLYASFPGFHAITKGQFVELYSYLKLVLNYDMVELVYKEKELKGFVISIPNFEGLSAGKLTPVKLAKILWRKKHTKEYVTIYMGVEPDALGLGSAMAQIVRDKLEEKQVRAVSALIHDGKATGHYYEMLYTDKMEYALYRKDL